MGKDTDGSLYCLFFFKCVQHTHLLLVQVQHSQAHLDEPVQHLRFCNRNAFALFNTSREITTLAEFSDDAEVACFIFEALDVLDD